MTKTQLQDLLRGDEKDFYYNSDYHTFDAYDMLNLIEYIEDKDYATAGDMRDDNEATIHEACDSAIPIYYADLARWFGKNWSAVNEYIDEFGEMATVDNKPDIMKTIQGAYYITYEREILEALNVLMNKND